MENLAEENNLTDITRKNGRVARDQTIDVLRGLNCFSMILVNTAGPIRPLWLSHPISIHQNITFADTLFPCFLFTSGLALAQQSRTNADKTSLLKRTLARAFKLSLIGIAYNNLIPRLIGFQRDELFNFKTYRIPSVLGRLGIASVICSLEPYFQIKPPLCATILSLSWYLISSLRPFEPLHESSQALIDRLLFGSSHLYNQKLGYDPEGILASLLTAPVSCLLGSYAASAELIDTTETLQLVSLGMLGMLLTGLIPSPCCKVFWSPTFVGQTTFSSLLYWSLSRALVLCPNRLVGFMSKSLGIIGRRSLEIYLVSSCCSTGLARSGIWDSIFHLLDNLLTRFGLDHDHLRPAVVGIIRSSLLGISMVPLANVMIRFNFKL